MRRGTPSAFLFLGYTTPHKKHEISDEQTRHIFLVLVNHGQLKFGLFTAGRLDGKPRGVNTECITTLRHMVWKSVTLAGHPEKNRLT